MEQIFTTTKGLIKEFLKDDSSGHDYWHAERVFNNALHLQQQEGGDKVVIGVASLVHDICRPREKQTGKSHFGDEALEIIRGLLSQILGLTEKNREDILQVIKLHDIYDRHNPFKKNIELQIVQDADNLDAIGAIGIGRTFAFVGAYNLPMHNPELENIYNELYEDIPGKYTPTAIGHFYEKLLKLAQHMNTKTGQDMAKKRHEYMEQYLEQFFAERNGEK